MAKHENQYDYEAGPNGRQDSFDTVMARCKRLAKFAVLAFEELERREGTSFLLLEHDDMRTWWEGWLKVKVERERKREERERKGRLRQQALSKLTDEEKQALGIK